MADLEESCGGTGVLNCFCGGDFCVCGMEEMPCYGCEDCRDLEVEDDAEYYRVFVEGR
jgi:hypothetical protein